MKILFFSLASISDISNHSLYSDLLREFAKNGHEITIISPVERRTGQKSELIKNGCTNIIKIRTGNIQKTKYLEKVTSLAFWEFQITRGIKKYCENLDFDCILYATPPITIYKVIKKIRRMTHAKTLLMLKDIWPQEIADLGIISIHGFIFKYLKMIEKKMYHISDWIGYTSLANKRYLLAEGILEKKLIAVNNSVDPNYFFEDFEEKNAVRNKYSVGEDKILFFYGGNLGRPQDIDYIISCLQMQKDNDDVFFIICGQGTEFNKLERFFKEIKPKNMRLFPFLPKKEYSQLIAASDVGLVFLNHRFTVPNCPTRFYDYMQYSKAVFACTDSTTDIREDIKDGDFGWWCESRNPADFSKIIQVIKGEGSERLIERGRNARKYLEAHYTVDKDYLRIINAINGGNADVDV